MAEDDACPDPTCKGVLVVLPVVGCTCFLGAPPCSACTDNPLTCDTCGEEVR